MSWWVRSLLSFVAFAIGLAAVVFVLAWFVIGIMDFASRPLVPTGTSPDVDLVVRSMQLAFQYASIVFAFISLTIVVLGFIGYRSLMERTAESLQRTLSDQIVSRLDKEAAEHAWRSESRLSGRLGYLLWRVSEFVKDSSLLDIAITDTSKGLMKLELVSRPNENDKAGAAILRNNLAYYYAVRYEKTKAEADKKSALEYAGDAFDCYRRYLGREKNVEIPFGAEEFADTRLMVLMTCDKSAKAKVEAQRICEVLESDLQGKAGKERFLERVAEYKKALET